jgi:hypothetical protein
MKRKYAIGWVLLSSVALFPALAPSPQEAVRPKVGELKDLADARAKVCEKMLDFYRESLKAPPAPKDSEKNPAQRYAEGYEPIQLWSKRLVDARLDGAADQAARLKILTEEVDRIKKYEEDIRALVPGDPTWQIAVNQTDYYRLEAEFRLAKEKAGR